MSAATSEICAMIEMLPEQEQELAKEFIKRMVLAWDPDFTKVTEEEGQRIKEAEEDEFVELMM